MNPSDAMEMGRLALTTLTLLCAPALLVSLVVGFAISLFQALTQIQEATLTFVPKLIALSLVLLLALPMMGRSLGSLMTLIADRIASGG